MVLKQFKRYLPNLLTDFLRTILMMKETVQVNWMIPEPEGVEESKMIQQKQVNQIAYQKPIVTVTTATTIVLCV